MEAFVKTTFSCCILKNVSSSKLDFSNWFIIWFYFVLIHNLANFGVAFKLVNHQFLNHKFSKKLSAKWGCEVYAVVITSVKKGLFKSQNKKKKLHFINLVSTRCLIVGWWLI